MSPFARYFPWALLVLATAYLASQAVPPSSSGSMQIHEFGKIPVVHEGRTKPFETLARNSLTQISGRQTFTDNQGARRPAIQWLLDVIADLDTARDHRVFRIENHEVLDELGLSARDGFRYAVSEFATSRNLDRIVDHARRASEKESHERDLFDRKILELHRQMQLFNQLASAHEFLPQISSREELEQLVHRYQRLQEMSLPHSVPPYGQQEEWLPFMQAMLEDALHRALTPGAEPHPGLEMFGDALVAYGRNNPDQFNENVDAYLAWLSERMPGVTRKAAAEAWFMAFSPFYHASLLYVLVFLLCCFAWLGWSQPLNGAAYGLGLLLLALWTAMIGVRIWLDGRPPVTNLYGSAIFVGWGCAGLGLLLEFFYRNGVGTLVAAVTGALALLVAHNLAADGSDTLGVVQAVLDTNFWLATHVITITLGYTAVFVAGFLGILFVLRGVFTRTLTPQAVKDMGRMIYGVLCFAVLLSFTGTVLGGIWADQSWGRFWGWDPKENGALMIVLWGALILHARWGGMVQQRGVAVLAIFGNVITAWSWFGTNMLGVGLHSYGFMDSAVFWLLAFAVSQIAIIALGAMPLQFWASFNAGAAPRRPRPGLQSRRGPEPGLAK